VVARALQIRQHLHARQHQALPQQMIHIAISAMRNFCKVDIASVSYKTNPVDLYKACRAGSHVLLTLQPMLVTLALHALLAILACLHYGYTLLPEHHTSVGVPDVISACLSSGLLSTFSKPSPRILSVKRACCSFGTLELFFFSPAVLSRVC